MISMQPLEILASITFFAFCVIFIVLQFSVKAVTARGEVTSPSLPLLIPGLNTG